MNSLSINSRLERQSEALCDPLNSAKFESPKNKNQERTWSWVKDAFFRSSLTLALPIAVRCCIKIASSSPVLALGLSTAIATCTYLLRKEVKRTYIDFSNLSRSSKLLLLIVPLVVGVTAPLLITRLNLLPSEIYISNKALLHTYATIFAGLTAYFRRQDNEIDLFFLRMSPNGVKAVVERHSLKIMLQQAFTQIADDGAEIAELKRKLSGYEPSASDVSSDVSHVSVEEVYD